MTRCACQLPNAADLTLAELRPFGSGCTGSTVIDTGTRRPILTGGGYVCPELARLRRLAQPAHDNQQRAEKAATAPAGGFDPSKRQIRRA